MTEQHTPRRMLVTGGCGFIGCNYVRTSLAADPELRVVVLDALTYAGDLRRNLDSALARFGERLEFVHADVRDGDRLARLFDAHGFDTVVNFAAETHVDRSIDGPREFVTTNVVGTFELLEAARRAWVGRDDVRFHHISTDEVFGELGSAGAFTEQHPYRPSSPYSASKAAADHLVRAWHRTYALPVTISGCSNNFGPYQHAEKLIPQMISRALAGQPLPVYGDGLHVRDWIYVLDHCEAIDVILRRAQTGSTYLVGARSEQRNLDLVARICARLDVHQPRADRRPHAEHIRFVADRPGHDRRYAVDPGALERELGWRARTEFEAGLDATVDWYIEHPEHLAR